MSVNIVYYLDKAIAVCGEGLWSFPLGLTPQEILAEIRVEAGRPLAIASTDFCYERIGG